jgi:hypothetical protein
MASAGWLMTKLKALDNIYGQSFCPCFKNKVDYPMN